MTLKDVGDQLRQERDRQGLSLDEVMHRTKLSRRSLEALEKGDMEALPHKVYARGFAKTYAKALGLDVDGIVIAINEIYGDMDEERLEDSTIIRRKQAIEAPGPGKRLVLGGAVLGLVIVVVLAWLLFRPGEDPEVPIAQNEQAVMDSAADSSLTTGSLSDSSSDSMATLENEDDQAPDATDASESVLDTVREAGKEVLEEAIEVVFPRTGEDVEIQVESTSTEIKDAEPRDAVAESEEVQDVVQAAPPEPEESPEPRPVAGDRQRVSIDARESCWGEYVADDGAKGEFFLRAGEKHSLSFRESLLLRLGNAGGVALRLNGRDYPVEAVTGQVKTLRFPAGD
jgi:cytoskeleton protein RodZ